MSSITSCTICGEDELSYGENGPTRHDLRINKKDHNVCHSCHVKFVRCVVCKEYGGRNGIKLGRSSETLVCEECLEKFKNIISNKRDEFVNCLVKIKNTIPNKREEFVNFIK